MTKKNVPATLGTVYIAKAYIQVIIISDTNPDKMVWTTLAECQDTPNAIAAKIAQARKQSSTPLDIWVKNSFGERTYIGR